MKRLGTIAAALFLCGCGEAAEQPPGPLVGRHVDAVLQRLDGGSDALSDFRGRTVVLNVWATWCPPCRWELPSLQALADAADPDRVAVLGLAVEDRPILVRSYLRQKEITFSRYIDVDGAQWRGLGIDSVPTTLIVGPDGVIRAQESGAREWNDPGLKRRLGLD